MTLRPLFSLVSALCLLTLPACQSSSSPGDKPVRMPKGLTHRVAQFPDRYVSQAARLPAPEGALLVLSDRLSKRPASASTPPEFVCELLRDGKVIYAARADEQCLKFTVTDRDRILLATVTTHRRKTKLFLHAFDLAGRALATTEVVMPKNRTFDDPQGSLFSRFLWGMDGTDALDITATAGLVHLAYRNGDGSVVYSRFREQADFSLKEEPAGPLFVEPAGGTMRVRYPSTYDVFEQKTAPHRVFVWTDRHGNAYVGASLSNSLLADHNAALGDDLPEATTDREASGRSFLITKISPSGKRLQAARLPVPNGDPVILRVKVIGDDLWLTGFDRRQDDRYQGFVHRIPLLALKKLVTPAETFLAGGNGTPSIVHDVWVDGDSKQFAGAFGFTFNPTGYSIGPSLEPLWERAGSRADQIGEDGITSTPAFDLTRSGFEYVQFLPMETGVCAVGIFHPYTHTCDDDWTKFTVGSFIDCPTGR